MTQKYKNIIYLFFIVIFFLSIIFFYFSDDNVNNTNKFRSKHLHYMTLDLMNLPLLENNTQNIMEYTNDVEVYKKKKKKYKFFELLKEINE